MKNFTEIDSAAQRSLKSYFHEAASLGSFDALASHFIEQIDRVIPNENPCWNDFSSDLTQFNFLITRDCYTERFGQLFESLQATLPEHPVLQVGGWDLFTAGPTRLSEHSPERNWFQKNPLYQEVYRHVDASHQICYHFTTLSDRALIFTLNRPLIDFNDAEMQKLQVLGQGMASISKQLETRIRLRERVTILTERLGDLAGISTPELLTPKETQALGAIAQCHSISEAASREGISPHTFAERLGSIREKLCLHNTSQLKALLRAFPHKNT